MIKNAFKISEAAFLNQKMEDLRRGNFKWKSKNSVLKRIEKILFLSRKVILKATKTQFQWRS